MSTVNGFNTWDDVAAYIENTLDITYTDNPTGWVEAMKELTKGYKYVKVVNDVTGETTTQLMREDLVSGVGEFHIGENTSTSSSTISGGGIKSAPTAKSVITENTGGGTAVITDEAIGVKDIGLNVGVKGINVLSGLLQIYGLVHTGIQVTNSRVWKDMTNYVFGSAFTDDTPIERLVEFLKQKVVNTITDLTSDGDVVVSIPDEIADRMYAFLSNHMIQEQEPGVYPEVPDAINIVYNFIHRTLELRDPDHYNLDRYFSVSNPTDEFTFGIIDISDDLFKSWIEDMAEQLIGAGYNVPASVIAALMASMDGVYSYMREQSMNEIDNARFAYGVLTMYRGSTPPPISTPLALNEFSIDIDLFDHPKIVVHEEEDSKYVITDFNVNPSVTPALVSGYSYQRGDNCKYLKRGKTGEAVTDYGYRPRCKEVDNTKPVGTCWDLQIRYPSNEQVKTYHKYTQTDSYFNDHIYINGFSNNDFYNTWQQDISHEYPYTNIGYKGIGESYQPDDYLVTAGFRSKQDSSGNPEKHPNPTKTKEQQYPEMSTKKQVANPQAVTDQQTGQTTVQNNIKNYVNASVPYGSDNSNRLINYGMNTSNPNSYKDNRPQEDKLNGHVNTEDPVDGYNEDTQRSIDDYNDSRNDPDHYPDPIPENQPNPQYPSNPPSDTDGDSGDTPDPSVIQGVTASGMCSVYNPTKEQLKNFSAWLWTDNVLDNLKRLLASPLDAIIGLHIMYATPVTGSAENIVCGYLDSGVAAKVVTQQFIEVDCGYINIPEYYGNAIDYEPYTQIHIYLPFVGIQSLKANDVIGKDLYVSYGVDVLTGTVLAKLTVKKGSSNICCYQFAGNCAAQIPLTGGTYAECIKSIASMAVGIAGSVVTSNPLPAIAGVAGGAMSASLDVSRSGALGANAGVLGVRKPYLIITRRVGYDAAAYSQFYGYPANKTAVLGTCKGFTRVKSIHIDSIARATDSEKTEIETLLKQGVIIK